VIRSISSSDMGHLHDSIVGAQWSALDDLMNEAMFKESPGSLGLARGNAEFPPHLFLVLLQCIVELGMGHEQPFPWGIW
jgi:hypothetical protein